MVMTSTRGSRVSQLRDGHVQAAVDLCWQNMKLLKSVGKKI